MQIAVAGMEVTTERIGGPSRSVLSWREGHHEQSRMVKFSRHAIVDRVRVALSLSSSLECMVHVRMGEGRAAACLEKRSAPT